MASREFPVAVIGMAVKLPGADNCEEFWKLMEDKKDTVASFPSERAADIKHVAEQFHGQFVDENNPFFTGSFFRSIDKFDADFFHINPNEALVIEPEQRIFLETVWSLLEDAGYASRIRDSNTGVYVGNTVNKYKYILTENHPSISHGNHSPFIASRLSYTYNLSGPAMMVATGCSSSLLAVHLACQGLLSGDCQMAIAGGITLDLLPLSLKTDIWNQLGITSPYARCKAFDNTGNGISKAEGCGVVLLKPLQKAIEDKDNIYGILEASTANQDGHSQGITAPHPGAQTNMLCQAWKLAGIDPQHIGYIEAHGTGTELGDPIEIMGITRAFERMTGLQTEDIQKIPIGSVKSNIGHLADGAAGVISLIKVLLCLRMNKIPASINFQIPNSHINWKKAPVFVNTEMREWKIANEETRYGCVSAFGLLGTNVHVVVKDSKIQNIHSCSTYEPELLCLASRSRQTHIAFISSLQAFLQKSEDMGEAQFRNFCYTVNIGREQKRYKFRSVVIADNLENMISELQYLALYLEEKCDLSFYETDRSKSYCNALQAAAAKQFLESRNIDWREYYAKNNTQNRKVIGFIPVHTFDRVRFWPEIGENLNNRYLLLEHAVKSASNEKTTVSKIENKSHKIDNKKSKLELRQCLEDSFNLTLGLLYNWDEKGNEDVFSLGVDSLISTRIALNVSEKIFKKDSLCFSQSELHENPTFNKLLEFLSRQLSDHAQDEAKPQIEKDVQETLKSKSSSQASGRLLFSQRRLWVIEKMDKSTYAYNATNCLLIEGDFKSKCFVKAVETVVSRHDAFYITVREINSIPSLVYDWELTLDMHELDLTSREENPQQKAMEMYKQDYRTGFDREHGPLVRVKLYKTGKTQWMFSMVVDHMIFDGWSHFLFYNELWDVYKHIESGNDVTKYMHTPLSSSFAEAEEEESKSTQSKMFVDTEFWLKKLSGPLPLTTFPGDKRRPEIFTYEGGRITRFLEIDKFVKLNKSVLHKHTMFHSLLGVVYVTLLHFNPTETDMIVGIPVSGRHSSKMKKVVGCFTNTLVIRCGINENLSFENILEVVTRTCTEAMDHQTAPFDHLVGKLKLPRNTSVTPVFSVNVCYHNEEMKSEHEAPPKTLKVRRELVHNGTSKWDVQFDFLEENGKMRFTLEYYKGIFTEKYAKSLVDTFEYLMDAVTKDTAIPIREMLSTNAIIPKAVLHGHRIDIGSKSVGQLLKETLRRYHSSKIKKHKNSKIYTYCELYNSALHYIKFFKDIGYLRKGNRVGLLFDNSFDGISIIAACLMSAIVYVPLPTESPKERLKHIVNESGLKAICFSKETVTLANHLLWECPKLDFILCVDEENKTNFEDKTLTPLMDNELWDNVADDACTDIEGGGWKNSYTGEYMDSNEMQDYVDNVLEKLQNYITPDTKVLEIGCASGITTQAICGKVKSYVATDLSKQMIVRLKRKNLPNTTLYCASAMDIDKIPSNETFDLIVINSVVHCFPGHTYLTKVLHKCESLLSENGVLFVGDVMDLDKREDLLYSLAAYKEANPDKRTKLNWDSELFLSKNFFECFVKGSLFIRAVCSSKQAKVPNELSRFRFDALLSKGEKKSETLIVANSKKLYLRRHLNSLENASSLTDQMLPDLSDDAYILYTSGTTGTPKGVKIGQRALLNYCIWATKEYDLNERSCLPLFSPLTFDFTVSSIVPPLLRGSTIEIFGGFEESYPAIADSGSINTAKLSPLQLDTILSYKSESLNMSKFIIGGEELTHNLLIRLKENKKSMSFTVWNEYGPTEATVGCVVQRIDSKEINNEGQLVPIGLPINNVSVAVVSNGRSLGFGAKGLLAISGHCLSNGFVKQSLNFANFKHACWDNVQKGTIMFVTSDIVSVPRGGNPVLYFGRKETDLIKINGIRVDVLEIQQAIESLYFVETAVVTTFYFNERTFIGSAVKLNSGALKAKENWKNVLITSLKSIIPIHYIPKIVLFVKEIPKNANGKKDISVLTQNFQKEILKTSKEFADTNGNEQEEKMRYIWNSVIPRERLPKLDEDFFFDLSGDSLLAISLVRKLRNADFCVSVNDIFRFPTIRKLCAVISKSKPSKATKGLNDVGRTFRPTPIVENYLSRKGKLDTYALPALLMFQSEVEETFLIKALQAVLLKHRALTSKFHFIQEKVFQEYLPLQNMTYFQTGLTTLVKSADEVWKEPQFLQKCDELERTLDLKKGRLVHSCMFKYVEGSSVKYYCLIVIHHIVVDIVSWQQILEDLDIALHRATTGKPIRLSPCVTPYETYCNYLWKGDICLEGEVQYWSKMAKSKAPKLFQNSPEKSFYVSAQWACVSTNYEHLKETPFKCLSNDEAVLLASLGLAISNLYGEEEIIVCLESHGRIENQIDLTDTVGWCTSMFPFKIRTNRTNSFHSNILQLKNELLLVPNKGVMFGVLNGIGSISVPLPEIMFVFLGQMGSTRGNISENMKMLYTPWVEVMLHELEKNRFHRDPNDAMEFPIQFICWTFENTLKLGCLYDQNRVCKTNIERVLSEMLNIIVDGRNECQSDEVQSSAVRKQSLNEPRISWSSQADISVLSNIILTSECQQLIRNILHEEDTLYGNITFYEHSEFHTLLTQPKHFQNQNVIFLVRHKSEKEANQFVDCVKRFVFKLSPHTCHRVVSLETLQLSKRLPQSDDSDLVCIIPDFTSEHYDVYADAEFDMPLTQTGYRHLAFTIARAVQSFNSKQRYKVLCVDADHTLWKGECANNDVQILEEYKMFQRFLVRKVNEGFLLVLLSKNNQDDIDRAFNLQNQVLRPKHFVMQCVNWKAKSENIEAVAKRLNLSLSSFVFMDDNPAECEEMVIRCPEVSTLQFPTRPNLIIPFYNCLWQLDDFANTGEAHQRTNMYKNEFSRVEQLQSRGVDIDTIMDSAINFENLLIEWGMELIIYQTTIEKLELNASLKQRVSELLLRTNQFKLNTKFTDCSELKPQTKCWVVSLKDSHGAYGIISVLLFEDRTFVMLKQWVLSCRALGRMVEHRLLRELMTVAKKCHIELNDTGKNLPVFRFLKSINKAENLEKTERYVLLKSKNLKDVTNVHTVTYTENILDLQKYQLSVSNEIVSYNEIGQHKTGSDLCHVSKWINSTWSELLRGHVEGRHIIPSCILKGSVFENTELIEGVSKEPARILQQVWTEVLGEGEETFELSFIRCGGDSFKAVHIISRIYERLGVTLRVSDVLTSQSFNALTNVIEERLKSRTHHTEMQHLGFELKSPVDLTEAQKRMVVLQNTCSTSTAYTETIALVTNRRGELNWVFDELVKLHPILSAGITSDGTNLNFDNQVLVFNEIFSLDSQEKLKEHITKNIPVFMLSGGPLSMFKTISWNEKVIVLVHAHHIIVDDVSLHNISGSLKALLTSSLLTKEHTSQTYFNAALDVEKRYYASTRQQIDRQYWENVFTNLPEISSMSLKPDIFNKEAFVAANINQDLSANCTKSIMSFCQNIEVTEFQLSLACFVLVLQRYMGTEEIVVAVPVTFREGKHMSVDGLFVNTVLFRYKTNLSQTFVKHVKCVAQKWMELYQHSMYPLNKVSEMVWRKHGKSLDSVCSTMFNYVTFPYDEMDLHIRPKHAKMHLSVDLVKSASGFNILSEFARDVLDLEIVERMIKTFRKVMSSIDTVSKENSPVKSVEFLTEEEIILQSMFSKQTQINGNNRTAIELFSEHAHQRPTEIAIVFQDRKLSYKELDDLSENLARKILYHVDLTNLKKQPVVLFMEKDQNAIACLFAVWKLGGHFLPLSIAHIQKLRNVVKKANACLVLTNRKTVLEDIELNCKIIDISNHTQKVSIEKPLSLNLTNSDLAYVIQTSGSTGQPKTIKIRQESLTTLINAWKQVYNFGNTEWCVLQWAPFSFDVFIGDVVRALCCTTGTLVVCPDEQRLEISYSISLIKDYKVTMIEVTPQFGLHLAENADEDVYRTLKLLILGSDLLQAEILKKMKSFLPSSLRLVNSYGMSEATIDSACYVCDQNIPETRGGSIPIGKALPGIYFKVLEPQTLRLCPIGTVGELFIGGNVIGFGDTDVIHVASGDKMLKTNDKAYWLPSGDIEIMGRFDSTQKVRGSRVNTTEIENKILQCSSYIKDVCVTVLKENENGKRLEYLCAFVVELNAMDWPKHHEEEIIRKLRNKIPFYMVPDLIRKIKQIPLLPNGKVHTAGLPRVSEILSRNSSNKHEHSELSKLLRELFAKCVGINANLIDDEKTFFEQGGHSLLLMQYLALIKENAPFEITVSDLFSYPSISTLRAFVESKNKESNSKLSAQNKNTTIEKEQFAITGIGLRLPGNINSLSELWELFENETDLIKDFPEMRKKDVMAYLQSHWTYENDEQVYKGAFLSEIDKFDDKIFRITAAEAENMSPEQRLFLEVATEALCQGTDISNINGKDIGVFLSNTEVSYGKLSKCDDATAISGQMAGMIASRIAYFYNLKGPTMLVDTACSSALSALKSACDSMSNGYCSSAIVGGINIVFYPARTGVHGDNGILSPDFKCRPFDKNANGTSVGEGIVSLYVEPLSQAQHHKKYIYGVIKSVSLNSVGRGNGITAPSSSSQQLCIEKGLSAAGVSPSDIDYIECHGTGTVLGDQIELSALNSVFCEILDRPKLPIGFVKSTLGHLDYAAGFAGLLKIVASLLFEEIPPTLGVSQQHREFHNSNLYVAVAKIPWKRKEKAERLAGLSSFGLTGTNCHAILADCPITPLCLNKDCGSKVPLLLCGASVSQIKQMAVLLEKLIRQTVKHHYINSLTNICFSVAKQLCKLQTAKLYYDKIRLATMVSDTDEVLNTLLQISKVKNEDDLRDFVTSDTNLFSNIRQKYPSEKTAHFQAIKFFLCEGRIETESLFPNFTANREFCVPGLVIPMWNGRRIWPERIHVLHNNHTNLREMFYNKVRDAREMTRTLQLSPPDGLLRTEGLFCSAVIIELLQETSLNQWLTSGSTVTFDMAFEITQMQEKYKKLFFIMIRELKNNDLVISEGRDCSMLNLDKFRFRLTNVQISSSEEIALKAVERFPSWADCFRFPLHCSKYLRKVLWGEMSPLSVIYPQGNLNFMFQFNKLGDLLGDIYYNMYMQLITEYASYLSNQEKTVRILEVGAGMGHVTRQLLPRLCNIANLEYWFTDLGKAFVENAKHTFSEYQTFMKFATFDITKNAFKQGILGSYDIVISYNVIHTTESITESVLNLKSCLGKTGTMFIIESAKNETWATLAWGILDGWWYFKDYDLRPYEPMLEPEKWTKVLSRVKFGSVLSCPTHEEERKHVEKCLFICSMKELKTNDSDHLRKEWWETSFDSNKSNHEFENEIALSREEVAVGVTKQNVKQELKNIWCELLGLKTIEEEEDFNSLGGESLLAIQMMTEVRKRIGYQLEIADTFCYTSLGALGDYIAEKMEENEADETNKKTNNIKVRQVRLEENDDRPISAKQNKVELDRVAPTPKRVWASNSMLLFPGQGAQKVGMCTSMKESQASANIFKTAEDILGYNVLEICQKAGDELQKKLSSTEFVQIALFVGCVAKIEQLRRESRSVLETVTHVAGLSVGEFAALVYAEVLSFTDALRLVQLRGRLMEEEVKKSQTAMASVLGPAQVQLQNFLDEYFPSTKISTVLADNQHTVAGTKTEIDMLVAKLKGEMKDKLGIVDVRCLRVAGAFHSKYMSEAAVKLKPMIKSIEFKRPKLPIIFNISGQCCDEPDVMKDMIVRQIEEPVLWKQSMETAYMDGIRHFVEVSPARVLSSIIKNRIQSCHDCLADLYVV